MQEVFTRMQGRTRQEPILVLNHPDVCGSFIGNKYLYNTSSYRCKRRRKKELNKAILSLILVFFISSTSLVGTPGQTEKITLERPQNVQVLLKKN
jgi:hypothetical protein